MAMTDDEQKALRSFCAYLLKEYGFSFSLDNPVIPSLYIIHKENELTIQTNKVIATKIEEVASRINPKQFNFYSGEAAWKFQLGIATKWILSGGLILLFILVAVWGWSISDEVDRAKRITKEAEHIHELLGKAKRDKTGAYFIDFTEVRNGSMRPYMKYWRLNDSTVRVHMGK